ncbi:glycoside hydrolase family 16 protein [Actinocorallia aurantiaca]
MPVPQKKQQGLGRARLLRSSGVMAVGGLVLGALAGAGLSASLRDGPPGPGLVFSDEFDGPAGPPDLDKWNLIDGHLGYNDELDYYRPENAALDGRGRLVITARDDNAHLFDCRPRRCAATSARLTTEGRFTFTYGRIEARIKVPGGQGMWPAFWARRDPPDAGRGEIDVMEILGRDPGAVHSSLHGDRDLDVTDTYRLPDGQDFAGDFHVFAAEWRKDGICFSVDGLTHACRKKAATPGWEFDRPYFLLLNLAVGGDWAEGPDKSTKFPRHMLVDYVRVSRLG